MSDEQDDIGADILAAMGGEEPAAPVVEAPQAEAETTEQTEARTRDEQGRFAKPQEKAQEEVATGQEPAKTILPPRSWTPAAKAEFASLKPEVQQEILRREGEIDAGKVQWETKAERFNRLDAALSPIKDRITLAGITEDAYVSALISADNLLRTNGPQALMMLAQQYGIQPAQVAQIMGLSGSQAQGGQAPQQMQPDPQIAALFQTVQSLQSRLESQDKAQERQGLAEAQAQIEAFRSDPKHIYFDNVREEMSALMQAGKAKDLSEAYDRATWGNPEIRAILTAQAAQPKAPTRAAGLSVTGAAKPGARANGPTPSGNTIDDDVRAALEEVMGRV